MRRPTEKFLIKFLDYQRKKWYYIYKLFNKELSLSHFAFVFYRLRWMLKKEIKTGSNIIKSVERMIARHSFEELEPLLRPLAELNYKLLHVLHQEETILKVSPFKLYKNHSLKQKEQERFEQLFNEELKLSKRFNTITEEHGDTLKLFKGFSKKQKEFERTRKLLRQAQITFKKLLKATTLKEAAMANKELMFLLNALQKTEFYYYIKDDVEFIKKKSMEIMKNPRKNKIKYFLTGIYLVSPFTFEATGVILVLRYATKYSVSKVKNVKNKIRMK